MTNSASPPSNTSADDELAVSANVPQTASRLVAEARRRRLDLGRGAGSGGPMATLTTQPRS